MSNFVNICSDCDGEHSAFTSDCPARKEELATFWEKKRAEGFEPDWIVMKTDNEDHVINLRKTKESDGDNTSQS